MTPEERELLRLRIEWWIEKMVVIGRLRILIGLLDLRMYAFVKRIAVREFIKKRLAFLYHVQKSFIFSFSHRPPPVVGRPRNVNTSDRHLIGIVDLLHSLGKDALAGGAQNGFVKAEAGVGGLG